MRKRSVQPGRNPALRYVADLWSLSVRNQSLEFYQLLFTTAVLTVFGLLMVLSASVVNNLSNHETWYSDFASQVLAFFLGFGALLVISLAPVAFFERTAMRVGGILIALQYVTAAVGRDVNGNKAWLGIGQFSFQPSEWGKILLILMVAKVIADGVQFSRFSSEVNAFVPELTPMIYAGLMVIGVIIQKDVGTALIMMIITLSMLWVAGLERWHLLGWLVLFALPGAFVMSLSSTRWPRILAWINPASDVMGIYTYQTQHGYWALAAGGLFGVGPGQSMLKWTWIPEVQNDFIFSVIVEEYGFLGGAAVLAAFFFLGTVLFRIFHRTQQLWRRLVVAGVFGWIVLQALVNIAVVIGALPVLGVPLPFISHGGTSMVFLLAGVGVVLAIERENTHGPSSWGWVPGRLRSRMQNPAKPRQRTASKPGGQRASGPTRRGAVAQPTVRTTTLGRRPVGGARRP